MSARRSSGILLHPTSLDSRFGIGDLGPAADAFLQFLSESGQRWWQMLPLGPTGAGNSPYQSPSSFAGNPLLISPEVMAEEGFVDWAAIDPVRREPSSRADFGDVAAAKNRLFRIAFERFDRAGADFRRYLEREAHWLDDFALYLALEQENAGAEWNKWPVELATRNPEALAQARARLGNEIQFHQFVQYLFTRQWERLRARAGKLGIALIGDLPIYVAGNSADVWARPDLFELDELGQPRVVAGVPPDVFNPTDGQRWGNPLYKWPAHKAEGFAWWIARLRSCLEKVDLLRLDHFRGFEAYWEIPAESPTAAVGRWVLGPGADLLQAVHDALGGLPLIAEDLGIITPEVEKLRDAFDLPGMKVLQFAFSGGPGSSYLPHHHVKKCVVYTGTHDNDTTVGWLTATPEQAGQSPEHLRNERDFAARYVGPTREPMHWAINRLALQSVGEIAILPIQDVLGLGGDARMNKPGEAEGHWAWRLMPGQLDSESLSRLAEATFVSDRWNGWVPERLWTAEPRDR
ncbi:MAG: 4-alpha-glucanotransferase [Isosphaeraceae bacterium]|nr:4-alpha-glucanotransferase [Isosphaeraceae bacterium]